ncbi:MAG: DEAD/DEAH box helicase [Spirochaetales bacterium]|nr:DEAD/DEAH box helicase [Spirochaetales bacterium]
MNIDSSQEGDRVKNKTGLEQFHPLVREWFVKKYTRPTPIQKAAWPDIDKGEHCLLSAPTGSGKTMAAFLSAINAIISSKWSEGTCRILYISPLKALNNDIQKNLIAPLNELKEFFIERDEDFPEIRVGVRSGDTSQKDRQKMIRKPPEILITTPESLNLLLSSPRGRNILTGIKTVILDEIHALLQEKRGTHLITGVERLTLLAGEFQRIGLSATLNPMSLPADFIAGKALSSQGSLVKRKIKIHRTTEGKSYDVKVEFPDIPADEKSSERWWEELTGSLRSEIEKNRSTLVFANSRRLVEKVTRLINSRGEERTAWSHHGSLSRELRLLVEEKLKEGKLKSIIATNSLELGIDIGELDQVLLLQAPNSISSALQKIGRAGHGVNQESKGTFYPLHSGDLLPMAVCAREALAGNLETFRVPTAPLDVLAQVLLSMVIVDTWDLDELYGFIRTAYPYRDLSRPLFDSVIHMLSGRYEDSRIRELTSRVYIDPVENKITAREGQSFPLYLSGGTIPDRGYYTLRAKETGAKIGELDEEFIWERSVGDHFQLGTMTWRITSIGEQDVEVVQSSDAGAMFPFWKGDSRGRDFSFSEKMGLLLEKLDESTFDDGVNLLKSEYFMSERAATALMDYLERQKKICQSGLPHRHRILLENYSDPANMQDLKQLLLHNFWGGKVNRPLAMLLRQAWEEKTGYPLDVFEDEDSLIMNLPHSMNSEELIDLLKPDKIMELLKKRLEMTGYFGARFRENAGRALLLPKKGFGSRTPLWLNRLRSRKLLAAVLKYPDFPITLETWRSCLNDDFDIESLRILLSEIEEGSIEITQCWTKTPSPFASGNLFQQVNQYMYEDDTPAGGQTSSTSNTLFEEIMANTELRPLIPEKIIKNFTGRMRRTTEGYAPENKEGLLSILQERRIFPLDEWEELKAAITRDHGEEVFLKIVPPVEKRIIIDPFKIGEKEAPYQKTTALLLPCCLSEDLKKLTEARDACLKEKNLENISMLTGEILAFYGPVDLDFLMNIWNIGQTGVMELTGTMEGEERILSGKLSESNPGKSEKDNTVSGRIEKKEYCRRDNFETLLRMLRKSRRPDFTTLAGAYFPLFQAVQQGLFFPGEKNRQSLKGVLNNLLLYPAPFELWESEILPARLSPYYCSWLDSVSAESEIQFTGFPGKKLAFCFPMDRDLLSDEKWSKSEIIRENSGYYDFWQLKNRFQGNTKELTAQIWKDFFKGRISNSGFAALRKGALMKWTPPGITDEKKSTERGRGRMGDRRRWEAGLPAAGLWYPLSKPERPVDLMEAEDLTREKIQILLERYGLLSRPILQNEIEGWRWRELLPLLRLMELSGEILSGYFFKDLPSPQFISHRAFRTLTKGLPEDKLYWMNALDPASPCGLNITAYEGRLPRRVPSNHMLFRGKELILVSSGNGKDLQLYFPIDEKGGEVYFEFFKVLISREFNPKKRILVETINGIPHKESPYLPLLEQAGFRRGVKGMILV